MSEPQEPYRIPAGHCSYCGVAVFSSAHWYTVHTMLGCLRLCDECGAREAYALQGGEQSWRGAGTLPASYRRKKPNRKGKKRG